MIYDVILLYEDLDFKAYSLYLKTETLLLNVQFATILTKASHLMTQILSPKYESSIVTCSL